MRFEKIRRLIGGREPDAPPPGSTIPRDVISRNTAALAPLADPAEASDTRAAARVVPFKTTTVLTMTNGKRIAARIINVSRSGVAVEPESMEFQPEDVALVGACPVTPGRRLTLGMVFTFRKVLDEKTFGPQIVL